jgi:hypothetical protein
MPPKPKRQRTPDNEPVHLDRLPPLYAHPREADNVVDAERERDPLTQHSQQRGGEGTRAIARELTQEELELTAWLKDAGFVGARAFVATYGAPAIQEAIADLTTTRGREIRNPMGFVRWLVAQNERR